MKISLRNRAAIIILLSSGYFVRGLFAEDMVLYRVIATNGSGIVSHDLTGMLTLTGSVQSTSFRVESATNATGQWASNRSYSVLANTGQLKKAFIPFEDDGAGSGFSYTTSMLAQSESRVWIDQSKYRLDPLLWRNYIPGGPPSGLIAGITLIELQSNAIPSSVGLSRVWVVNTGDVWNAVLGEQSYLNAYKLWGIARNGPEWDTGIYVDVIVEATNSHVRYLMRATNQLVRLVE